jgi:sarcosine oxidase gamma subunit
VGRERRRYPRWILAWRSPTETWVLGSDPRDMTELEAQFAASGDACAVDQTGGIGTLRVQGERTDDLLLRLGSTASVPSLGEARTSRIAEIAVMTLRVRSDELLLLFENAHAGHLLGWIEAIAADLQPAG